MGGAAACAAVAACGVALAPPRPVSASAADGRSVADGADASVQYGFLVDASKCVNCGKCVQACRERNNLSEETPDRRRIWEFVDVRGKDVTISTSCMHCAQPNCERVCPAGAISKGACGIVSVNKDVCIGCKYCYQACPYGVPHYDSVAMDKCDACRTAGLAAGETPYCVRACEFNALLWGPMDALARTSPSAVKIAEEGDPSCLITGRTVSKEGK